MGRVFIQGDRDTSGEIIVSAAKIGKLLAAKGWQANVASYGNLVEIMEQSGVLCHAHIMPSNGREVRFTDRVESVTNCNSIAETVTETLPYITEDTANTVSWGTRLWILLGNSDAFLFFPGRAGTLAHLVPVMTFNRKHGWKNGYKKVVLFGWLPEQIEALKVLGLISSEGGWLTIIDEDEELSVTFLTS